MKNASGFTHWVIIILISVMAVGLVGAAWYYEENKEEVVEATTTINTNQIVNSDVVLNNNKNINSSISSNLNTANPVTVNMIPQDNLNTNNTNTNSININADNDPPTNTTTNDTPTVDDTDDAYGIVSINNNDYTFDIQECLVQDTDGGPPTYILEITLRKSEDSLSRISFSVQDPNNSRENLLTPSVHTATGKHWDRISNNLNTDSFSWIVKPEEMDIIWDAIQVDGNSIMGEGYIDIKQNVSRDCPEKVWIGGRYAYKGDADYSCNYDGAFYPPQTIFFKCSSK